MRGRRRRFPLEFLRCSSSSSTPDRGSVVGVTKRSSSAGASISLGTAVLEQGPDEREIFHTIHGQPPSPALHSRKKTCSANSEHDPELTPVSNGYSVGEMSEESDASAYSGTTTSTESVHFIRSQESTRGVTKHGSRSSSVSYVVKQKVRGSIRVIAGTQSKRKSGSLFVIPTPTNEKDDLDKTPTNSSQIQPVNIQGEEFIKTEFHPDFQGYFQQNTKRTAKKRRRSSFSSKSLLGAGRKSLSRCQVPSANEDEGWSSTLPPQKNKKRRISDINLKEILGGTAKIFAGREKEPKISEDSLDLKDFIKKLPLIKKHDKSPTTEAKLSPARSLIELLKSKAGILSFHAFLRQELSEENLDFWIECEVYKQESLHKQRKLAPNIYQKYVENMAPREVNLEAATRRITKANLEIPDAKSFDLAQYKIFKLMERDSFRRYREHVVKLKAVAQKSVLNSNVTSIPRTDFVKRKILF